MISLRPSATTDAALAALLTLLTVTPCPTAESPAEGPDRDPRFPCEQRALLVWNEFRRRGIAPDAGALRRLLDVDREGRSLVPWGDGAHVSVWAAANRLARTSPALPEIRRRQESEARELLRTGVGPDRPARALTMLRRCPWARCVHAEMLDVADALLREGRSQLALRHYTDVFARTDDPELRAGSRVGAWIALAQHPGNRSLLESALRSVEPGETFPLLGRRLRAEEVLSRILPGHGADRRGPSPPGATQPQETQPQETQPNATPPATWPRRELRLPGAEPWVVELGEEPPDAVRAAFAGCARPVHEGGRILLAGPNLLACFDGARREPAWSVRSSVPLRFEGIGLPAPIPCAPRVADGLVYARWGVEKAGGAEFLPRVLKHVIALDVTDGRPVWTTRNTSGWEDLSPVSDPVPTDGRVYVLVAESFHPNLAAPILLACLDAATGTLLWRRHLVTGPMSAEGAGRDEDVVLDVTRFGAAITVARGAVYCLTNAGAIARCDARDGLIEWVRSYGRDARAMDLDAVLKREGGSPVLLEDVALFLPRDSVSLHAVSVESGRLAWTTPRADSRWLLGRCGSRAILAGDRSLLAVEAATGRLAWETELRPLVGRPHLLGGTVYAGTEEALHAIDGEDGEILGEWAWEGVVPREFVIAGGSPVSVELREEAGDRPRQDDGRQGEGRSSSPGRVLPTATSEDPVLARLLRSDLRRAATRALKKAATFYRTEVARHGGYVYYYSLDLSQRWGEGVAAPSTIFVQPPGTPTVGMAYLEAHAATGDRFYLDAAREAAEALVAGQLESGGWTQAIHFGPARRRGKYRKRGGGSWNVSSLDDGQTQAALRMLIRADRALEFGHAEIHEAARYGLDALLAAQFPNGAFPQGFRGPVAAQPVLPARFPDYDWRTEGRVKNYWDYYTLNDNVAGTVSDVLIEAHRVYGDERYGAALEKLGDFLILAQMPEPQPGWCQQYSYETIPIWARKFEPPAITGWESQDVMETLIEIAKHSGKRKYLEPVPRALEYFEKSLLPDGSVARYYELETNRPLYMDTRYRLTYDDSAVPGHYGWKQPARLESIRTAYDEARRGVTRADRRSAAELPRAARQAIRELDAAGRWVTTHQGERLVGQPKFRESYRYISSAVFSRNVEALSEHIAASRR